jgi:hypothetical protein
LLNNLIKYYQKITDSALKNLKDGKNFQFRKYFTNRSLFESAESYFLKHSKSEEAREIIKDYKKRINNMTKTAVDDYNVYLKKIKSAKEAKNDELLQKLLNDYANRGIKGFTAKNGAKWNIETYSTMLTVHTNNKLVRLKETEKIKALGGKKVKISNHNTICDLCKPYEGKILTFAQLDEAINNGLYHPNCKHFHTMA